MGHLLSKVKTSNSVPRTEKMAAVGFKHFAKAQSTFKPPLIANENAFLGDVASRYSHSYHVLKRRDEKLTIS
jgi:hypothetical protein